MPSTPYAKLLISVAGGAAASGGQSANAGDALSFSYESTVGWGSPAAKVEIYSYPSSFSAPAGWSTDAAGVIYYQGNTPPPGFTLSANAADWGKYLFRLTVLGGLLNGVAAAQLVDEASGISVASANGLKDVAYLESTQFSASRSWAGALQDCLRTVENALVAGGTYVAGAGLTESPAGTFNVAANADGSIVVNADDIQVGVLASDAQHGDLGGGSLHAAATSAGAGFMPAAHFTLVDGATSAADPSTLCKRGASSECSFGSLTCSSLDASAGITCDHIAVGSTVASAGDIRGASTFLVGVRTSDGLHDHGAFHVGINGADQIGIGDNTYTAGVTIAPIAGGFVSVKVGGTERIRADTAVKLMNGAWTFDATSLTIDSAIAPSITHATRTGTGANAGATLPIRAQDGQAQSGANANNNGGAIGLYYGAAGTGGSGAAGYGGGVLVGPAGAVFPAIGTGALRMASARLSNPNGTVIAVSKWDDSATAELLQFDNLNDVFWGEGTNVRVNNLKGSIGVRLWSGAGIVEEITSSTLVTFYAPTIAFGSSVAAPAVKQSDSTTASATGQTLTVRGQSCTGTTSIGGDTVVGGATGTSRNGNIGLGGAPSAGGGGKVVFVANATTLPSSNPTGGSILYSDAGALKARGSSGTVTTVAPADPHCPTCGRDYALEWQHEDAGEHLAVCVPCMLDELEAKGSKLGFVIRRDLVAPAARAAKLDAAAKARAKQEAAAAERPKSRRERWEEQERAKADARARELEGDRARAEARAAEDAIATRVMDGDIEGAAWSLVAAARRWLAAADADAAKGAIGRAITMAQAGADAELAAEIETEAAALGLTAA